MTEPKPVRDAERLPESLARQVLARASELDAAQRSNATVAELRAAAEEAGISAPAFDAALEELRGAPPALPSPAPRRATRWWISGLAAAGALFFLMMLFVIPARVAVRVPSTAAAQMTEQTFQLRCLGPDEAAALVRPLLNLSENTVQTSPRTPRVLTVKGTPEQLRDVRAVLDKLEGSGTGACPVVPSAR